MIPLISFGESKSGRCLSFKDASPDLFQAKDITCGSELARDDIGTSDIDGA
jgi:hypothetical protein